MSWSFTLGWSCSSILGTESRWTSKLTKLTKTPITNSHGKPQTEKHKRILKHVLESFFDGTESQIFAQESQKKLFKKQQSIEMQHTHFQLRIGHLNNQWGTTTHCCKEPSSSISKSSSSILPSPFHLCNINLAISISKMTSCHQWTGCANNFLLTTSFAFKMRKLNHRIGTKVSERLTPNPKAAKLKIYGMKSIANKIEMDFKKLNQFRPNQFGQISIEFSHESKWRRIDMDMLHSYLIPFSYFTKDLKSTSHFKMSKTRTISSKATWGRVRRIISKTTFFNRPPESNEKWCCFFFCLTKRANAQWQIISSRNEWFIVSQRSCFVFWNPMESLGDQSHLLTPHFTQKKFLFVSNCFWRATSEKVKKLLFFFCLTKRANAQWQIISSRNEWFIVSQSSCFVFWNPIKCRVCVSNQMKRKKWNLGQDLSVRVEAKKHPKATFPTDSTSQQDSLILFCSVKGHRFICSLASRFLKYASFQKRVLFRFETRGTPKGTFKMQTWLKIVQCAWKQTHHSR